MKTGKLRQTLSVLAVAALLGHTSATSLPTVSLEERSALLTANSAESAMITVPIVGDEYYAYDIVVTDADGKEISVLLDYMQPHLWLIDADKVLNCLVAYSYYSSYNYLNLPQTVTYSSAAYDLTECYIDGAYMPMTTTTEVNGTHTQTITRRAADPSTSAYNITYPYDFYGSGNFVNGNFLLDTISNGTVELGSVQYLLANDTNAYQGAFGVAGPSWSGGVLDTLKTAGRIAGNGYSAYFFTEDSSMSKGGYLLLGSVDKALYTGDFYAFPSIPHEGWGDALGIYPIVQLDSVELKNVETSELATLYDSGSVGVIMDPTVIYLYLPREMIINLALQTNAYYNPDFDAWIVNCSAVSNIDAEINFNFGPLTIDVPLLAVVESTAWDNLTFPDGQKACVFNILPLESLGYAAFGASFLQNLYLAMDNEGGKVGLANANTDFNTVSGTRTTSSSNTTTVGHISSGSIPFATNALVSSDLTFTFGTYNFLVLYLDPGLLTNVVISSGHVYISHTTHTLGLVSASAADARSTVGGAGSLNVSVKRGSPVLYVVLLLGGIMGVLFI